MDTLPPHDKIDVIVLEKILSDRYLTLSYKLFWFKAVVDLVEMGEQKISFRKIVYEMIAAAWYMVTEYKLKLGYLDNLYAIIGYQGVNGFKLSNENISQEEFAKGMYSTIFPLHQIASNQGFGVWTYEG